MDEMCAAASICIRAGGGKAISRRATAQICLCLVCASALAGLVQAAPPRTSDMEILAPTVAQASFSNAASSHCVCGASYFGTPCSCGQDDASSLAGYDASGCDSVDCDAIGCDSYGCDSCGSVGCGGCSTTGKSGLLGLGIIKPSDRCFDDFISPMTNPVFFEDPRTLTEARFIFLNHNLPNSLGGNSVQVYALQIRAALTERLSLIATKDGLIYTQSPVLDSGFADIAAGLKYNLFRDVKAGRLLSAGVTFEAPTGSSKSLQGNGNGEFHFFVTGGTRIGDRAHWLSASGLREPADTTLENRVWYWSNHFDYQLGQRPIYAFTELNWYNFGSSGTAFPLPIEGGDIFNLGSVGITGNDLVTHAIGLKAKPRRNIEAGVAWEYPMTERKGLLDNRLTADLIWRY